jgi:membrane protease YdiL (CAAX protease family)
MTEKSNANLKIALFWTVMGVIGILFALPCLIEIISPLLPKNLPIEISQTTLLISALINQTIQNSLLVFFGAWIGLKAAAPIGLNSPLARQLILKEPLKITVSGKQLAIIIGSGVISAVVAIGLDWVVFHPYMPKLIQPIPHIQRWKFFLAAFYGGVTEEILTRLFGMSVLIWGLWRLFEKKKERPSATVFWIGIILASLVFGAGHLPLTAKYWKLTAIVVTRALVLNSVVGIVCGFFYWRLGLEYAMIAHFSADIVLHVFPEQ